MHAWAPDALWISKMGSVRSGLFLKAHRLVYHSTLGWRVIKKKKQVGVYAWAPDALRISKVGSTATTVRREAKVSLAF